MGLLSWLDKATGAQRRTRRQIAQQIADAPGLSRERRQSLASKAGLDLPDGARRWESSQTTRLNSSHWANATGQPINADLASWLTETRHRAMLETANNPLARGMALTYSLCVVGRNGPTLRVHSEDEAYTTARQDVWRDWFAHAGTNPQLSGVEILNSAIDRLFDCGEWLWQLVTMPQQYAPGPIRTRLLPIHPHRLLTPPSFLGDPEVALGVRRNTDLDIPTTYYVTKPYIWGPFELYTGQFLDIPYRDMVHGFWRVEEYQVRGAPWLAPCLDTLGQLRDFVTETLDAARAAADWAVYLKAVNPDVATFLVNETSNVERRTVRTLPPGWDTAGATPAHPGPEFIPFYESLCREIGRTISMPLMILLLDSRQHNLSSARFDAQLFWRQVGRTQGFLGRCLDRIERQIATEAELAGELPAPPKDARTEWVWDPAPQMDPKTERETDRLELENGTVDYGELCERNGRDPADLITKRAKWNDALEKAGLPTIPGIPEKIGGAPGQEAGDEADKGTEGKTNGKQGQEPSKANGKAFGNRIAAFIR